MFRRVLLSTAAATAVAGSALAADLPSRRPPPQAYAPPPPIFTWSGFYVGVNAGAAFRADNNNGFNNAVFAFGGAYARSESPRPAKARAGLRPWKKNLM